MRSYPARFSQNKFSFSQKNASYVYYLIMVNTSSRIYTFIAVMLIAVAGSIVAASDAKADYFGARYADNSSHDFWYSYTNLGSARYNGVHNARIYSLEPTDISTSQVSTPTIYTDVLVIMSNPNPSFPTAYAWFTCTTTIGSDRCDQGVVYLSNTVPHSDYWSLACHEIGHSVGLKDGQNATYGVNSSSPTADRSCMRSSPDHRYYSNHDKGHINAKY